MCRKALKKNRIFDEAFSLLGKNWSIDVGDGILPVLKQYVCTIFGCPGEKSANVVRLKLFEKYTKGGKVINMDLLPPCNSSLFLHIKRSNYVEKIWRSSLTSWLDADEISENRWLPDGSTYWVDDVFPPETEEILCGPKYIENDDFDEENEQTSSYDDSDDDTYWDILIFKIEFLILKSLIIQ